MKSKKLKCRICGRVLSEMNVVADEQFHFNGTLHACEACGTLGFPKEILYFNRDRSLTTDNPLRELPGASAMKIEKIEAEFYEPECVIVCPFSSSGDKVEGIELHVGKNRLNEDTALFALTAFALSLFSFVTRHPLLVDLKFAGFNADPREVYDIDEIRAWMSFLYLESPEFICQLPSEGLQIALITLVRGLPKDHFSKSAKIMQAPQGAEELLEVCSVAGEALIALKGRIGNLLESGTITENVFGECKSGFVKRLGRVSNFNFQAVFRDIVV